MASALPPTWINISPRLLGPERDCVSSALSDIWRAGGKPVGRDPPHSLGETVGDRSSPVWWSPLTFSPLLCSLSSSPHISPFSDHPFSCSLFHQGNVLWYLSVPCANIILCLHYITNFSCETKISLLCFHPSSNSTCFQDRRALRPALCPAHVPNEEISLAPKPTLTLHVVYSSLV